MRQVALIYPAGTAVTITRGLFVGLRGRTDVYPSAVMTVLPKQFEAELRTAVGLGAVGSAAALERALKQAEGFVVDATLLAAARELLPKLVEAGRQLLQRQREENEEAVAQMATAAAKAAAKAPELDEAAVRPTEAEGLTLLLADSAAGYRGVIKNGNRFQARVMRDGVHVNVGSYATAAEAALAYASTPEAQAQVANLKGCSQKGQGGAAAAAAAHLAGLAGKMKDKFSANSRANVPRVAIKRAEQTEKAEAKALELKLPSDAMGFKLTFNKNGSSYKHVFRQKASKHASMPYRSTIQGVMSKGVRAAGWSGPVRASAVEAAVDVARYLGRRRG